MRTSAPIQLIIHPPGTKEGQRELSNAVANVHADIAGQYIQNLDCPAGQKAELMDAILKGLRDC
ncbi:hypothetical protein D3Z51_02755 [Clostridiaceae bacterium]|nr:hypothetical protein [Clostridiaceae bacterium]RKI18427.1 hypothetical protein D7V81_00885 [bacterium 1XD21-70]